MFKRRDTQLLNDHGQPVNIAFSHRRVVERQIDELIGLCKGVLADGMVSTDEARLLLSWLETNRHCATRWPAKALYPRILSMLQDGVLDVDEERELIELLLKTTGGPVTEPDAGSMSTRLPLDEPPPRVVFDSREFCFTGKFCCGTRSQVQEEAKARGGIIASSPRRKTHYLVIGDAGSRDWIHSTHGRKIERALELREAGNSISILSEEHWVGFLE